MRETRSWAWSGVLFGADASIDLYGMEESTAARLTRECFRRLRALEDLFSLYRADSVVCRLNRDGMIERPPRLFVELLLRAREFSVMTDGAFDVTVQPLWACCREQQERDDPEEDGRVAAKFEEALLKVGYGDLYIDFGRVRFGKPGMAITLNGIAQGFVTDQITAFLRREGVQSTLVNMGEYRAIGEHPDGRSWRLGVRAPGSEDEVIDAVPLRDAALAVSGGHGMAFGGRDGRHHLMHPVTGECQPVDRTLAVTASTATEADALSTACAVVDDAGARRFAERSSVSLRIYRG